MSEEAKREAERVIEETARMVNEDMRKRRPGVFLAFDDCTDSGREFWRSTARDFLRTTLGTAPRAA